MLDPLDAVHFVFERDGFVGRFNVASLVDYLHATGNFVEPQTRLPFSDDDLERLDVMAAVQGLGRPSVKQAKEGIGGPGAGTSGERGPPRDDEVDAPLEALDALCGDAVAAMLEAIETKPGAGAASLEVVSSRLLLEVFPLFAGYFGQLAGASWPYAVQSVAHHKRRLAGPPNRPVQDLSGLRAAVTSFLDQQLSKNEPSEAVEETVEEAVVVVGEDEFAVEIGDAIDVGVSEQGGDAGIGIVVGSMVDAAGSDGGAADLDDTARAVTTLVVSHGDTSSDVEV
jgi:hypothetical protein